jgi:hypothetical protein
MHRVIGCWLVVFAVALQAADVPAPRPVSLRTGDLSLAELLREIGEQTGNPTPEASANLKLTSKIELEKSTFWKALDAVADGSGATVDLYQRSGRVALAPRRGSSRPPVSHDGLFRCALRRVTTARDFETGSTGTTVQLEVAWEPRVEPLLLETRPRDVVLENDKGEPIAVPTEGSVLAPVDGKPALTFDVGLPAMPRSASKIGRFAGKLTVVAPVEMASLEFGTLPALAAAKPGAAILRRGKGGMTCTVTKVELFSDRATVQVRVDLPPGGPRLESYQSWVVNNELTLVENGKKEGRRLRPANYALDASSSRHAVVSYNFTDAAVVKRPDLWTVKYRTATGLVEIPIAFAFKDVALP